MAGSRKPRQHPDDPFANFAALRASRRRFLGTGRRHGCRPRLVPPWLAAACGGDDDDDTSAVVVARRRAPATRCASPTGRCTSPRASSTSSQDASGLTVDYKEDFNDNEQWFAKVKDPLEQGQDIGADLVVPTDYMAGRLISLDWLNPLNDENLPNKSNLRPDLLEASIDPERVYTLPYMSGMVGSGYNRRLAGREITSIDDLWIRPSRAGCRCFDKQDASAWSCSPRETIRPIPNTEAVQKAADRVAEEKDKGQIRRFTGNDYIDDLAAGNLVIAQAYSGDVVQLQADDPDLDFIVPEAGGTTFVDVMAIPITTRNQLGAEEWMNYVYDRVNYAQLVTFVQYVPVLSDMTDELTKLDPEVANNPLINPPATCWPRLYAWPALSDEQDAEYTTIYADITGE